MVISFDTDLPSSTLGMHHAHKQFNLAWFMSLVQVDMACWLLYLQNGGMSIFIACTPETISMVFPHNSRKWQFLGAYCCITHHLQTAPYITCYLCLFWSFCRNKVVASLQLLYVHFRYDWIGASCAEVTNVRDWVCNCENCLCSQHESTSEKSLSRITTIPMSPEGRKL